MKEEFGSSFRWSDLVIVTRYLFRGELPLNGVSAKLIVTELQKNGQDVVYISRLDDVVKFLMRNSVGDLILTIAGNVWTVGRNLAMV